MKIDFNTPQYYWEKAKLYIESKDNMLRNTDYCLDKKLALKCVKFGSLLKHTSGSYAGQNFQFQDWQIKAIVDLFATKYRNGKFKDLRRYQRALLFIPKKNGKSEFAGLLHAIMFFVDKDNAKEQYSIATEAEQAKIIHKVFLTMLKQERELYEMVHHTVKPPRIVKEEGHFTDEFQSLTSSADTKDGLRPSFLTIDEGHAHTSKELYQIMTDGLAGRDEPLEIHLSTAGYNQQGFFYRDIYTYAKKIRDGVIVDDRFYAVLFEPSEEDMKDNDFWKDEKIWKKVNPNLGVSPTYSYMEGKISQAEQSEESLIAFKTKHLNVWCDKAVTWIKHSVWSAGQTPINEDKLAGRKCYGGLDLSSTTDITALVLEFPNDDGSRDVITRFWIPGDNVKDRVRRDKVPYYDWIRDGILSVTPGNVVDYDYIEKEIMELGEKFNIHILAYDRWNSSDLIKKIEDSGVTNTLKFGQGFASMASPTKQIEVLSLQNKLNHGNNEALNWMCSNVVIQKDAADNMKIDKDKSIEKVDGMVALAMAEGAYLSDNIEEKTNTYEKRGMRSL